MAKIKNPVLFSKYFKNDTEKKADIIYIDGMVKQSASKRKL
jgi:hypothetical protein